MLRGGVWSFVLLLLCPAVLPAQDGHLEQVRRETNRPAEPSHPSTREMEHSGSDDDDGTLAELTGILILGAVTMPFAIPHAALGDDFGVKGLFPRYPYSAGPDGYLWLARPVPAPEGDEPAPPPPEVPAELKPWAVRLCVEDGNDFRGLNRLNGQFVVDTSSRFGLRTGWNYLREDLGSGWHDDAVLGDANLTYRFAQNEWAQFYAGLGFRTMTDPVQTRFGFNFTYGADFFPARPVVVSTSLDLGSLGSAAVVHVRGTVGAVWKGCELFGGYDFLRIGSVNLQGPLVGLRFWF
jgi:hypothetical protein